MAATATWLDGAVNWSSGEGCSAASVRRLRECAAAKADAADAEVLRCEQAMRRAVDIAANASRAGGGATGGGGGGGGGGSAEDAGLETCASRFVELSLEMTREEEELRVMSLIRGAEDAMAGNANGEGLVEAASAAHEAQQRGVDAEVSKRIIVNIVDASKKDVRAALHACGWPPEVTASSFETRAAAGAVDESFGVLCGVALALGQKPQTCVYTFAEMLVEGVSAMLKTHFGGGIHGPAMPTARADKPEWLFAHASRVMNELLPSAVRALRVSEPAVLKNARDDEAGDAANLDTEMQIAAQVVFFHSLRELLRRDIIPRILGDDDSAAGGRSSSSAAATSTTATSSAASLAAAASSLAASAAAAAAPVAASTASAAAKLASIRDELMLHFVDEAIEADNKLPAAVARFARKTASARMPWQGATPSHALLAVLSEREEWLLVWASAESRDALAQMEHLLPRRMRSMVLGGDVQKKDSAEKDEDASVSRAWTVEEIDAPDDDNDYGDGTTQRTRLEVVDELMLLFDAMMARAARLPDLPARHIFLAAAASQFMLDGFVHGAVAAKSLGVPGFVSLPARSVTALEYLRDRLELLSDEPFYVELSAAGDGEERSIFDPVLREVERLLIRS